MSATDDLLEHARAYAQRFDRAGLPAPPARKLAVVACMDARLNLYALLGLAEGDAHIIRNAGGVVTDDEIRSLAISQHLLGTEEVVVIHHTDCGMLKLDDEDFARRLETAAGVRPHWAAHGFGDLDESVRNDVRRIRESPFLPRTGAVRGFVFDVATGELREVA